MANPKHLELLIRGVETWNKWRELNEDEYEGPGWRKKFGEDGYVSPDERITTQ